MELDQDFYYAEDFMKMLNKMMPDVIKKFNESRFKLLEYEIYAYNCTDLEALDWVESTKTCKWYGPY